MFFSRSAKLLVAIVLVSALSLISQGSIGQNAVATPILQSSPAKQGSYLHPQDLKRSLQPVQIPISDLPPSLRSNEIFRTLASGGFAGQTYETLLFRDGRMIRSRVNLQGTQSEIATSHLSLQQVQQFEKLVHRMKPFDRLNYSARSGSADVITVTATSHTATIQYADSVQSQLPSPLRTILQAWNRLVSDP